MPQPTWVLLLTMSIPLWLQCTIFWCYFQQDNAPCHKAQIISDWFLGTWQFVHFIQLAPTVTRSQSNRALLGCGGTGDSHHGCAADKSAATAWCYHVNMDQNLWGKTKLLSTKFLQVLDLQQLRARQFRWNVHFWSQIGYCPGSCSMWKRQWLGRTQHVQVFLQWKVEGKPVYSSVKELG